MSLITFPKIKSFEELSTLNNISFPWIPYVTMLNKGNPALFIGDDEYEYNKPTGCEMCGLSIISGLKDKHGNDSIYFVDGLYKHHKPVNRTFVYSVCAACFYMLKNPLVENDYPKTNRKDENYMTFLQLKRTSCFGYHGKIIYSGSGPEYIPHDIAIDENYLNLKDYCD